MSIQSKHNSAHNRREAQGQLSLCKYLYGACYTISLTMLISCNSVPSSPSPKIASSEITTIAHYIPSDTHHPTQWAKTLARSFDQFHVTPSPENICAALAIIENGSGFQANPKLIKPERWVNRTLYQQALLHHIPGIVVSRLLHVTSPDGRSYNERIAALKTQKDVFVFFEDMLHQAPKNYVEQLHLENPINTAGPMQVPIWFGQSHQADIDTNKTGSWLDAMFTQESGVRLGIAYLFTDTATPLPERFFYYYLPPFARNNALFLIALGNESHQELRINGLQPNMDAIQKAAHDLSTQTGLTETAIDNDLRLFNTPQFAKTELSKRIITLAHITSAESVPNSVFVVHPLTFEFQNVQELTQELTTQWHACLAQRNDAE